MPLSSITYLHHGLGFDALFSIAGPCLRPKRDIETWISLRRTRSKQKSYLLGRSWWSSASESYKGGKSSCRKIMTYYTELLQNGQIPWKPLGLIWENGTGTEKLWPTWVGRWGKWAEVAWNDFHAEDSWFGVKAKAPLSYDRTVKRWALLKRSLRPWKDSWPAFPKTMIVICKAHTWNEGRWQTPRIVSWIYYPGWEGVPKFTNRPQQFAFDLWAVFHVSKRRSARSVYWSGACLF